MSGLIYGTLTTIRDGWMDGWMDSGNPKRTEAGCPLSIYSATGPVASGTLIRVKAEWENTCETLPLPPPMVSTMSQGVLCVLRSVRVLMSTLFTGMRRRVA